MLAWPSSILDTSIMIFYFYGDNNYEIAEAIKQIKTQYIKKTGSNADMEIFDMTERTIGDLLNSLSVVPMFVTSRLIVVKELSSQKPSKEKCEQILESAADTTNIVIVDTNVDRRSVYFKTMSAIKNAKEFRKRTPAQLLTWLKKQVEQQEATADNRTLSLLIDRVGTDQWKLSSEVSKLANYNKNITVDSIDKLVVANLSYNAFAMVDNIVNKNAKKALEIYASLKLSAEADQKILGAIIYQYRILVLAKDNQNKTNSWVKQTKTSPYAATKAQRIVSNLDMQQLKKAYQLIVEADFKTKKGIVSSQDGLEQLILDLSRI